MGARLGRSWSVVGALIALYGLLTVPFWIWPIDLAVQSAFFDPERRWPLGEAPLFEALYDYGVWPAYGVGGAAAAALLAGLFLPQWARWRRTAAYLALCLALGPGLVVNVILKDHWGRPRPRNVEQFGGAHAFEPVWVRDASSPGRSFPSGHASAGFYFLAVPPLLWPRRRRALAATAAALGYGSLLGLARMAQGGHFASDVLWAAAFCTLTPAALFIALQPDRETRDDPGGGSP